MSEPPPLVVDVASTHGDFTLEAAFEAGPGVTGIFGRSGAGKTTLLHLIAGLYRPRRGQIALSGETLVDVARGVFMPKHKRRIGLVFQDAQLFPHMTVAQNLAFGRWFAPREENGVSSEHVIDVLGIAALLGRRPQKLSGGEKQRVALARALLSAPRLLLLDEPLAGLDDARRQEILPLIERVRDDFKVPMLYVTHARDEVMRLASKVIVLEAGRVTTTGTPAEVLAQNDR
ncbi:MAG: molybdenum ABC transporter ATP-binding protein [Hyphomicrobium sp.]